jgi:hypothetical protein
MYALQFTATILFASLCLFLLNLLLFGFLAWGVNSIPTALEERWARCVGERGEPATLRLMVRATRMRQTRGGHRFKTAVALLETATGLPLLYAVAIAIATAGVYLVMFVLRSYTDTDPFRNDLAPFTLLICVYVVYLLSPIGVARALRWMFTDGKTKLTWPAPFAMNDAHIDALSRFEAAKAVYRLHVYLRTGLLSAAITTLMLWSQALISGEPPEENQRAVLIAMIGTATVAAYLWAFERLLRSRTRRWHALEQVTAFLNAQPKKRSAPAKADTAGKRRKALQAVVAAAERQAQYLQAGAGAGVTHPTALLLTLSVAHLREHLSGHDSALDAVPPEVAEPLERMAIVLAGTSNTTFLAHTEERLQRFRDEVRSEGTPARAPKLSTGIDLTERATALLVKVIVIGLALWLLVSQQIAAKDLMQMLP